MKQEKKHLFHVIIGTGFGSGFCPYAPGTAGAVLATLIWLFLSYYVSPECLFIATSILIILFTGLGVWSSRVLEKSWGEDPSKVVVDEMVGVWIPLLAADRQHFYTIVVAFVLFRLFDIFKPLGIKKMENMKNGWGVMMDDIVAGVYSLIALIVCRWIIG